MRAVVRVVGLVALGLFLEPDKRRMTLSELFTRDQLQLMFPPPESLELVMQEHPPVAQREPEVLDAERGLLRLRASGWPGCRPWSNDSASDPPADLTCVGFLDEGGRGNVMRCHYTMGERRMTLACSEYMSAILIEPIRFHHRSVERVVHDVALGLFGSGDESRIVPLWLGHENDIDFGCHDPIEISPWPADAAFPPCRDWREHLRWWVQGDAVGFITLKDMNCGTSRYIYFAPELTRDWFYPAPDKFE